MHPRDKEQELAEQLQRNWQGPMSEEEVSFLHDVQGFIDFAIRNGLSFPVALSVLAHDLREIRDRDFSLGKIKAAGFPLKTTGYAQYTEELAGQTEDDD